jgi:hypothetical protein
LHLQGILAGLSAVLKVCMLEFYNGTNKCGWLFDVNHTCCPIGELQNSANPGKYGSFDESTGLWGAPSVP